MRFALLASLVVLPGFASASEPAADFDLVVEPIEVRLSERVASLLTSVTPYLTDLAEDEFIRLSWKGGKIVGGDPGILSFDLDLTILPAASIGAGDAVLSLTDATSGTLRLVRSGGEEEWGISQYAFHVYTGQVRSFSDGRIVPYLPLRLVNAADGGQTAYGTLAIMCSMAEWALIRCDRLVWFGSSDAPRAQGAPANIETVVFGRKDPGETAEAAPK